MEELTILEIQSKMEAGTLTSRTLCEAYLDRIYQLDQQGPKVNSVIQTNPDALDIADQMDTERQEGKIRGPLHGIPILLKDNIATKDGMETTAGSIALEGTIVPRDAYLVKKLRKAGAVILGKTNLSEWANFRGNNSISGWSSRGGLTRNPHVLSRSACGSSSGSAAAVAANFCAAAIGTETDGSIICPAQTNGIVGIKPTVGLISRSGIIPISHSQDTAGPMARTVTDAAILLGALTGQDKRDSATQSHKKRKLKDYTPYLDESGLKGARIGVARNLSGSDQRVLNIFDASLEQMKDLGAEIIDPLEIPNSDTFRGDEFEVMCTEIKAGLDAYMAELEGEPRVKNLEDLIDFNEENKAITMPFFGQERFLDARKKGTLEDKVYQKARQRSRRLAGKKGLKRVFKEHKLDAIVVPSGGPAWLIDLVDGDANNWDMQSCSMAAVAGYPHITVPMGQIYQLPIGLSFIGRRWQEGTILKLAYAFEQATHARIQPGFLQEVNFL